MAEKKNNAEDLLKIVGDEVMEAVNAASGNLKGESFETVEAALEAAGNEDSFFNPTLSQYREGLCINTHREVAKINKVPVGRGNRKAWCITCPAGYKDKSTGKVVYSQAFNFYPTTLRKQIQVTDEMGDQVLDENKQPLVVPAVGNQVWTAAREIQDPKALLNYALDKVFETSEILRDFGPSVFVEQKDGSNKATAHKLTSVPQFNIIG
jgi:hypothetical protein